MDGISAAPSEENLRYFNVIILGPESSPYEGLFTILFFLLLNSKILKNPSELLVNLINLDP